MAREWSVLHLSVDMLKKCFSVETVFLCIHIKVLESLVFTGSARPVDTKIMKNLLLVLRYLQNHTEDRYKQTMAG